MKHSPQSYALIYYPTRHGPRYVSLYHSDTCSAIINAKREGRYLGVYPEDVLHSDRFWRFRIWEERGEGLQTRISWARKMPHHI